MGQLVKITSEAHSKTKLSDSRFIEVAFSQHVLALRVTEVCQAASAFPIFVSRHPESGELGISAITSFEPGKNLFVQENRWDSSFLSAQMVTFPLFLMKDKEGADQPVLGLFDGAKALNEKKGHPLIENNEISPWAKQIEDILIEDVNNAHMTKKFLDDLELKRLIQPVNIQLQMADGKINTIRGLNMIQEDNFDNLSTTEFEDYRETGYLPPIYAMLYSVFQLNNLIRRNNLAGRPHIQRMNIEVVKDQNA